MLAAMKLGAVIDPGDDAADRDDLVDRFDRGRVRHVVTSAEHAGKFADLPGDYTRIAVGGAPGWQRYEDAYDAPRRVRAGRRDQGAAIRCCSISPRAPRRSRSSCCTAIRAIRSGHLSTMYWIGLRPGDIHLNISSPGWAKHAWSCVLRAVERRRLRLHAEPAALQRDGAARHDGRAARVTTFCAPPTVWRMLIQEDLKRWKMALKEVVGAGEPLNPEDHRAGPRRLGPHDPRRLRPDRDDGCRSAISPARTVKPGAMGRPAPGYRVQLLDADGQRAGRGRDLPGARPRAPLGADAGLSGRRRRGRAEIAGDGLSHRRCRACAMPTAIFTYVGRADDVFKASDYRISPFELESALIEHAAVAEAAVVPSPDPMRLAVPKAFCRARRQPRAEPRHGARHLPPSARDGSRPFKRIRRLEFAELPKTISGKIRRVELRRLEAERRARGERAAPSSGKRIFRS